MRSRSSLLVLVIGLLVGTALGYVLGHRPAAPAAPVPVDTAPPPVTTADEGSDDVAKSREVTVGKTRVVLLKVNQALDYTTGGKKPVKSLEVWYLVEQLDEAKIGPVPSGMEVFAAGTRNWGWRSLGSKEQRVVTNASYEGYEKQFSTKLPAVKAKDRALVMLQALRDIELTAKRFDLELHVGPNKDESHTVWFKGVSFE